MNRRLTIDQGTVLVADFDDPADNLHSAPVVAESVAPAMPRQSRQLDAPWLPFVIRQLRAVKNLPAGWDSHGGATPNALIIAGARSLIESIAQASPEIPKPHVSPTPAGGVQFDWEHGARYFEIEFTGPTVANFYFEDSALRREGNGTIHSGQSVNQVIAYVQQVASGG